MNLDKPILIQWILWVADAVSGDFGNSFSYHVPVTELIGARIGITFTLGLVALCISIVFGIFLGIVAATHRNGILDNFINVLANIGISVPAFGLVLCLFIYLALGLVFFLFRAMYRQEQILEDFLHIWCCLVL